MPAALGTVQEASGLGWACSCRGLDAFSQTGRRRRRRRRRRKTGRQCSTQERQSVKTSGVRINVSQGLILCPATC
jgi:hypothetical protein